MEFSGVDISGRVIKIVSTSATNIQEMASDIRSKGVFIESDEWRDGLGDSGNGWASEEYEYITDNSCKIIIIRNGRVVQLVTQRCEKTVKDGMEIFKDFEGVAVIDELYETVVRNYKIGMV